jgi:cysteine desulfurase / selenocysteine lyase
MEMSWSSLKSTDPKSTDPGPSPEPVSPETEAAPLDVEAIRRDFPILARKIHGRRLVYLDNAATSQKPFQVLERITHYYRQTNANIHRGIHRLAEESTALYEGTRERTARFIQAPDARGVIFTRGTTEAINLLASAWGHDLKPGDEILLTEMEHHSNLVPWFLAARERGAIIRHIPVTEDGRLDLDALPGLLGPRTRIVSLTHVSNVLGTINPVAEVARAAHAVGALVSVDGAQSAPHLPIDVAALGCDAFSFSAHKTLGPTGVGVLYVKPEILEKMEPYQGGGEMIREVRLDGASWAEIPHRFEAGTPDIAGVVALGPALDYLERVGFEALRRHEEKLLAYALNGLKELGGFRILGPAAVESRSGVIAFADPRVHPHDLSTVLDQMGVAIRAGHHCAQPLHRKYGLAATARASFYLYNDLDDVDALIDALREARRYFG